MPQPLDSGTTTTAKTISTLATARISGLKCSRMPDHIRRGMVRWSRPPTKVTTTTSSRDATNANTAPEATPREICGSCTPKNVASGPAPKLAAARLRSSS